MDVFSNQTGKLELAQNEDTVQICFPITFLLNENEGRQIHGCRIDSLVSEDGTEIKHGEEVRIRPINQPDQILTYPVSLRPEDASRQNTLEFTILLPDSNQVKKIKTQIVHLVLGLTFRGGTEILFLVVFNCNPDTDEISIDISRQNRPWQILTNFFLLVVPLLLLYYWNNHINESVHSYSQIINPATLQFIIGFTFGFFGLQVLEVVSWFTTLDSLAPVIKFPELYLNRPVLVLFQSKVTVIPMAVLCISVLMVVMNNQSARRAIIPDKRLSIIDDLGKEVIDDRVLVRDLVPSSGPVDNGSGSSGKSKLRVVCSTSIDRSNPIVLGSVYYRPASVFGVTIPFFGNSELIPQEFTIDILGLHEDISPVSGSDLLDRRHEPWGQDVLDVVCNTTSENPTYHVEFDDESNSFLLRTTPEISIVEFSLAVAELREAAKDNWSYSDFDELVADPSEAIERLIVEIGDLEGFVSRDVVVEVLVDSMGSVRPGIVRSIPGIVATGAVLEFYGQGEPELFTKEDLQKIVRQYQLTIGSVKEGVAANRIDHRVVRSLWRLMLQIEKFSHAEAGGLIHTEIEKSHLTPEYLLYYLDECCKAGALRPPDGAPTGRQEYFLSELPSMRRRADFDAWLGKISLRCSTEAGERFISVLGFSSVVDSVESARSASVTIDGTEKEDG